MAAKPLKIKNAFIDTDNYPFEVLGFWEELIDLDTGKLLGTRPVAALDRQMGQAGRRDFEITEPIEIQKGHRLTMLKASPAKPKRVAGVLNALCGKPNPNYREKS